MVGEDNIFLLLVQTICINNFKGVFLRIDRALLQGHVNLRECHGAGVSAQCLPDGDMQLVFHHADLLALHIVGSLHSDVAGHLAHSLIEKADQLKTIAVVLIAVIVVHCFIVHSLAELLGILVQEGQINHAQFRHKICGECC